MNKYNLIKKDGKVVPEHRAIVESIIKRPLKKEEIIHHADFDKKNNNISNLALFDNQTQHARFHHKLMQFGMTRYLSEELNRRLITNL